ncbi:MAG: esterase-like activity of phytase family protein [Myxococcaceae bacterium]|nr:esterase-like activity of phytase family protein [Myxococcaceae bacterium]
MTAEIFSFPVRRPTRRLLLALLMGGALLACKHDKAHTSPEERLSRPRLVGRAVLPAATFAPGPPSGARVGTGAVNGIPVPFDRQPVQGFSGVLDNGDGTFLAMTDNGYGALENSADFLPRVYTVRPDFKTREGGGGGMAVEGWFELRDPDRHVAFPITNHSTAERLLTGADFDIESLQRAPDGTFWFGDEFGPFLLHTDATGKLLEPPIPLPDFDNGGELRSPQNKSAPPDQPFRVPASGGFESMAISKDGQRLYPMLEKALVGGEAGTRLIHEFDIPTRRYTGVRHLYPMEARGGFVTDFILFDESHGLVLERDNTQGDLSGFKALYEVKLNGAGQPVTKRLAVDLLRIDDALGLSGAGAPGDVGLGAEFAFPFVTIEAVLFFDSRHVGILNDNNFPFSIGRHKGSGAPDDTEFIRVQLDQELGRL